MKNEDKRSGPQSIQRVSAHGGHSGSFCDHARDSLQEIVERYFTLGYSWVGITEHMPPPADHLVPPEERKAGLDSEALWQRFGRYMEECRALQERYRSALALLVGVEAEFCTGYERLLQRIIDVFRPDYLVGSLHHVDDLLIDASPELFARAVGEAGGMEALYCRYFDQQYDLLYQFRPAVVGHFDLVRLFDTEYRIHLALPSVHRRIRRNLETIQKFDLLLDLNLRAFSKGQNEPYPCKPILIEALQLGIALVPGDDSHGVDSVGMHWDQCLKIVEELGVSAEWRVPATSR
ncbi:MAG: histidinol-phosphatase [Candidatus Binataceae bacterium]